MIISRFGKPSNHFSQIKEVQEVTQNSWKKMKYYKIIKKFADKLNTFFKNAVSSLDINYNSSIINEN